MESLDMENTPSSDMIACREIYPCGPLCPPVVSKGLYHRGYRGHGDPQGILRFKALRNLQALGRHQVDQIAHAAGVSPLDVIPGDHLDAVVVHYQGHGRVYDAGAGAAFEVARARS